MLLIILEISRNLMMLWFLIILTFDIFDRIKHRKEYKKQGSELVSLQVEQKRLFQELKKILEDF